MSRILDHVIKNDLCMACGACGHVCPSGTIGYSLKASGDTYSAFIIDELSCTDCGLCYHVCPAASPQTELNEDPLNYYTGYSKLPEIRHDGASGGVVTQILISAFDRGEITHAAVVRSRSDDPFDNEYYLASNIAALKSSQGSLYSPVDNSSLYSLITAAPMESRIAMVGLPCTLTGLNNVIQIEREMNDKIALRIGLICGRMPDNRATDLMLQMQGISRNKVVSLKYRGEGWPGFIQIEKTDGTVSRIPYRSTMGMKTILSSNVFLPKGCYFCGDALASGADITAGDAWIEKLKGASKGWSAIIVRSETGAKILKTASNELVIKQISSQDVNSGQKRMLRSKGIGYLHRIYLYRILNKAYRAATNKPSFALHPVRSFRRSCICLYI